MAAALRPLTTQRKTGTTTMTSNGQTTSSQKVWLVRYGLTEFPLQEGVGPYDSDIDAGQGLEHAKCIAQRIAQSGEAAPCVVYASPFLRTTHTAQIIAAELPKPTVRVEEGLYEWLVPSLLVEPNGKRTYPKSVQALSEKFSGIDLTYESVNPVIPDDAVDIPEGSPHFEESEEALMQRCAITLQRILYLVSGDNIAIVSHAPCDIAMALYLEGSSLKETKLGAWPLGGLTLFSRPVGSNGEFGDWTLEFYGDVSHMPGKYAPPGLKHWALPSMCS